MQNAKNYSLPAWWCKVSVWILALIWCAGNILGCIIAALSDNSFYSMMRTACMSSVSIVSLATVYLLPFLLIALSVYFQRPQLLLLLAFLKAFQWSFSSMMIMQAFSSGGWLVRILLLFSDCGIIPVLYWVCVRCISGNQLCKNELFLGSVVLLMFAAMDYCIVSPYLALLIC